MNPEFESEFEFRVFLLSCCLFLPLATTISSDISSMSTLYMLPKTVVGLDLFAAHQCLSVQMWPALNAPTVVESASAENLSASVLTQTLGTPYPRIHLLSERWPYVGQALDDMIGWMPASQWFGLGNAFEVIGAFLLSCIAWSALTASVALDKEPVYSKVSGIYRFQEGCSFYFPLTHFGGGEEIVAHNIEVRTAVGDAMWGMYSFLHLFWVLKVISFAQISLLQFQEPWKPLYVKI